MTHTTALARHLLAAATALAMTTGAASAQGTAASHGTARFSAADRTFTMKTAMANNYELVSAKLALEMATAAEHKTYAQHIVDDHTKVGAQLKAAVAEAAPSVVLPSSMDAKGTARISALRSAGSRFDAVYTQQMIDSHQEIHAMFQAYLDRKRANPGVKAVIAGAQPTVVMHLNAAKKLPTR